MNFDEIVDLIDNLPDCPFCKSEVVTETDWNESEQPEIKVSCSNEECPAGQIWVSVKHWSTRPLEDALQKKLELALAHDVQSYPTADAYEKVCVALEKNRKKLDIALRTLKIYRDMVDIEGNNYYSLPQKYSATTALREIENIK